MASPKAPLRVLLVDDSAVFLTVLRDYVDSFPQLEVVSVATSGEQAVALAERLAPELVLMDLEMPGIGGVEATRIIKSLTRRPRVAIVTLHASACLRRDAFEGGADFFVRKDCLQEEFPAVLQRILES